MLLDRTKQGALWLLVYNLNALFMRHQMDLLQEGEAGKDSTSRHALSLNFLDECLEVMNLLKDAAGKERTFFMSEKVLGLVSNSINQYDSRNNFLHRTDADFVDQSLAALRDLVARSSQFSYTEDELRKAGVKWNR